MGAAGAALPWRARKGRAGGRPGGAPAGGFLALAAQRSGLRERAARARLAQQRLAARQLD